MYETRKIFVSPRDLVPQSYAKKQRVAKKFKSLCETLRLPLRTSASLIFTDSTSNANVLSAATDAVSLTISFSLREI